LTAQLRDQFAQLFAAFFLRCRTHSIEFDFFFKKKKKNSNGRNFFDREKNASRLE
jgi:hypothetical protein